MAKTLEVKAPSGMTLTAEIFLRGGNTLIETVTLTEKTVAKTIYEGTLATASGNNYEVALKSGASYIGTDEVYVGTAATATYRGRSCVNMDQAAGSETAATVIAAINAALKTGTVDTGTFSPTTLAFETSLTQNSDEYTNQAILWTTGANTGLTSRIVTYAYANAKDKFTVGTALPNTPTSGDAFVVLGRLE